MDLNIKFERKITNVGASIGNTIPKELLDFLELENGSKIEMSGLIGKYGKYIAIWKKQE